MPNEPVSLDQCRADRDAAEREAARAAEAWFEARTSGEGLEAAEEALKAAQRASYAAKRRFDAYA